MLGWFGLLHMVDCLGGGEVELVGGLDVRRLLEHGHELWQVEEAGEPGPCPVAGALGVEFVKILFVDFLN